MHAADGCSKVLSGYELLSILVDIMVKPVFLTIHKVLNKKGYAQGFLLQQRFIDF
ncbi:MAG: hypothetical protein AB1420_15025 [Bacillota bacterium]